MTKQIKHIVRLALVLLTGIMLVTTLPACKASKCDCPWGRGQKH